MCFYTPDHCYHDSVVGHEINRQKQKLLLAEVQKYGVCLKYCKGDLEINKHLIAQVSFNTLNEKY